MGGGATASLLTLPTDPNTIWLASVNGGIWKTTNGGLNWTSLTDFKVPSLSVSSITFDPTDPTHNTIIAAVSSPSNLAAAAGNTIGFYYTTDGGNSWTVPSASIFQPNGLQPRVAFKLGQTVVLCLAGWFAGSSVQGPFYVSNNLGNPGTWTLKGTTGARCADMLYISSTNTFIAAIRSEFIILISSFRSHSRSPALLFFDSL